MRERREFFHPEIQAEMEFGMEQSKATTAETMLDNLDHFLKQDADWDNADREIVNLRASMAKKELPAAKELAGTVTSEIAYQYAMWSGDYAKALEQCRIVLGQLLSPDLKGYRALWYYLAGSAASLANAHHQIEGKTIARDYFTESQKAAPSLRWLVDLRHAKSDVLPTSPLAGDDKTFALVERLEGVFESLGTTHDRKFAAEEAVILKDILQNDDGKQFERGHERLGRLLGFDAGNSEEEAAPDPWWTVDQDLCFVFEDHAEGKPESVLSATKARQAASHPNWIRSEKKVPITAEVVTILITPTTKATKGALPHLRNVQYWEREAFRGWAKSALQVIRDLRRDYPGPGHIGWRAEAAMRLRNAKIGPSELKDMLKQSAFDLMKEAKAERPEEEEA
jgi:hypothetical protein